VGHYFGYRNFKVDDASTNLTPLAIFIGGEELHNNHHTYPTSAKLSVKWWEFDIGWLYIKIFSWLGLAKVKRVAPKEKLIIGKKTIDIETIKAIIANRFEVMTNYTTKVVAPIFKQEQDKISFGGMQNKSLILRDLRDLLVSKSADMCKNFGMPLAT
jgi:stearoyl-CoA desaturase (delta-9 desaturase)